MDCYKVAREVISQLSLEGGGFWMYGRESTDERHSGIHIAEAELLLFGRSLRIIWILLFSASIAMEVIPRDPA